METFKREIYEQLGNLFYAVAAEQHVPLIATGAVKMVIRNDSLDFSETVLKDRVPESAHLIGVSIDALQGEDAPPGEAYDMFEMFYREHKDQFSDTFRTSILSTVEKIVDLFPTPEKKNIYFERLKDLFEVEKAK